MFTFNRQSSDTFLRMLKPMQFFLFFVIFLFLFSGSNVQANEHRYRVIAKKFHVKANDHSVANGPGYDMGTFNGLGLDTGISVVPGQLLVITCNKHDKWSNDPDLSTYASNANGVGNPYGTFGIPGEPPVTLTLTLGKFTFLYSSLVGSLDDGNTFFPIGTKMVMSVLNPGTLRLYFWDSDYDNNVGSIKADVKIFSVSGSDSHHDRD